MRTDYHCHILPEMDDGAKDIAVSFEMLKCLQKQGVERVVATPHYYAHQEKSVSDFLVRRKTSFDALSTNVLPIRDIRFGAEVAIEQGISALPDLEKLAISGTNLILLEFPYSGYADWMSEEVFNISCIHNLVPVLAHVHRYRSIYSKAQLESVLQNEAIFQMNNEVFGSLSGRRFVKKLLKNGKKIVFGSDCHNMDDRKPNFDLLLKKMQKNKDVLNCADNLLDRYLINGVEIDETSDDSESI